MSTKKEEKAAFERLKREFPELDVSLTCEYATYREVVPCYYVTICGGLKEDYSGIGKQTLDVDEAVDYIIEEIAKKGGKWRREGVFNDCITRGT